MVIPPVGVRLWSVAWSAVVCHPLRTAATVAGFVLPLALLPGGSAGAWALRLVASAVCGAVGVGALVVPAFRRQLSTTMAARVDVARAALRAANPDVVVGSSWGGALAVALMEQGDWGGRTVLLGPAHGRVARAVRAPAPRLPATVDGPVHIVHAVRDTTCPIEDSRHLQQGTRAPVCTLLEVHGDGHALKSVCAGAGSKLLLDRVRGVGVIPAHDTWHAPRP